MTRPITVTFDYRCPFARNAHEAVAAFAAADDSVAWTFQPFFLDQPHTEPGAPPVWERPEGERGTGALAIAWAVAIRDHFPDRFLAWHVDAFAARHDRGEHLEDPAVVRAVAAHAGLDVDAVDAIVATGEPLAIAGREHQHNVDTYAVFGVPTFVEAGTATFIRFMERGRVDDLTRALDLLDWHRLNEFKRTQLSS